VEEELRIWEKWEWIFLLPGIIFLLGMIPAILFLHDFSLNFNIWYVDLGYLTFFVITWFLINRWGKFCVKKCKEELGQRNKK